MAPFQPHLGRDDMPRPTIAEGDRDQAQPEPPSGLARTWFDKAMRASRDAADWKRCAPGLAEVRRSDARWLMRRFWETLDQDQESIDAAI